MQNEANYPTLLFGVSQQVPRDRLPGQVTTQTNMISDLVTGIRRRPPFTTGTFPPFPGLSVTSSHKFFSVVLRGNPYVVVVDATVGSISVYSDGTLVFSDTDTYFQLTPLNIDDLRLEVIGDAIYVLNVQQQPTEEASTSDWRVVSPNYNGFFWVPSGQYSTDYIITVDWLDDTGAVLHTVTQNYVTPDGTAAAHIAQTRPEYIAEQLRVALAATVSPEVNFTYNFQRIGGNVHLHTSYSGGGSPPERQLRITANTSNNLLKTSGSGVVTDVSELPPRLPYSTVYPDTTDEVQNIAVGGKAPFTYYTYQKNDVWAEDAGKYWPGDQVTRAVNMPYEVTYDGATWAGGQLVTEFRASGDTESNPLPHFVGNTTGIGTIQGRLVLLAGQYVCMSGTNDAGRWTRSTLRNLIDTDPIEIASTRNFTSDYQVVHEFDGSFLVLGNNVQSTIPGEAVLSPSNAAISVSSYYPCDPLTATPLGQSVYLGKSDDIYAAVLEMVTSRQTSGYTAIESTAHIPTYIQPPVGGSDVSLQLAGDPVNSYVAVASLYSQEIVVYKYLDTTEARQHHAWFKLTTPGPINNIWIREGVLHVVLIVGDGATYKYGLVTLDLLGTPDVFIDCQQTVTVVADPGDLVGNYIPYNETVRAFDVYADLVVAYVSGDKYLEETTTGPVQDPLSSDFFIPVSGDPGDDYVIGVSYLSEFEPTPPIRRDQEKQPILTSRDILSKYVLQLVNTAPFQYEVSDNHRTIGTGSTGPVPHYQLELDEDLVGDGDVVLPSKVLMHEAKLKLSTNGIHDLNIIDIAYRYKKRRRMGRR